MCLDIMNEFLGFPCSNVFQKPVECRTVLGPSNPLSLPIVRERLTSGAYAEPGEWARDMTALFRARLPAAGEDGLARLTAYLAEDYLRRLSKRMRRLSALAPEGWLRRTERLNLKLGHLLQHAPRAAAAHFPVLQVAPPETARLNAAQYDFIVRVCPRVTAPLDLLRLSRIVDADASAGTSVADGEMRVDLAQLAVPTACAVFDLLRHLFPGEPVEPPARERGFTARCPEL
jgi:hypothetical protein